MNSSKRISPPTLCLLAVASLFVHLPLRAATLHGRVCLDAGTTASCPQKAQGVADVAISNGREVVRSDGEGRYSIKVADGDTVFAIKPANMAFSDRSNGLPRFWQHYAPNGSPKLKYGGIAPSSSLQFDVALRPLGKVPGALDMLVFGDPQPKSLKDVGYYDRDIVAPLVGHSNARLGISLGDIASDDLSLYPAINAVTTRLHQPWLHVPGNHDVDVDAGGDAHALDSFRNIYGPDTYAWLEPQASFIVLDDVVMTPGKAPGYIGGFRDEQFTFLESVLPMLDRNRLLVLSMHIPLFEPT
ncbi:MAG: calcineurin phosphoesterase, partial [Xanthomonadales bacterium]|nr:calcineurin phosphoesterase [Xanthomonadales bacterium]